MGACIITARPVFNKIFSACRGRNSSNWCMMPKRSLQNSAKVKKIKLTRESSRNSRDSAASKIDQPNLKAATSLPRKIDPETAGLKMTVNHPDCDKKVKEIKVHYLDTPVKSESDKKEYRVIKLENGLTALLVSDVASKTDDSGKEEACAAATDDECESGAEESDEDDSGSEGKSSLGESDIEEFEEDEMPAAKPAKREEKMAACSLCVGVGSFSDPIEIQGMAHFLEHMVFMGSEKYPEENDFDAYIKKCGGSDNAYTDCEQTCFYFEIQEKHLQPAMDRFAQFFISPLMKRDAINREREAVESEFRMALPSDSNRKEQLFCSLAKKNHPATKFAWGNLNTLRDNVDEDKLYSELHEFRKRHYSAHRMTLAVQARLPLDTLEEYVKDCFSDVPVNHLPADDFSKFVGKDSFDNPDFRKLYKIKPIKDVCQVELTWVMPPLHHLYRSKPHQYVSWIIGHEGKGSLINYLRKKMWCLDIFCGNGEGGFEHSSMYALFSLSLVLTDEGHNHFKEVLEAVFSYINMLSREGPQRRIFDEIQQIENIDFRFTDEDDPVEYVEAMSENMHFFPPKDYITGSDLYFDYNPEGIKDCIDALSPDNVNIILFDKKFNEDEFDQVEPWFQTKYSSSDIPTEWIETWRKMEPLPEFHLPKPNMYITDDFSLIELPTEVPSHPEKIHHDDKAEIWYRADPKFRLPECYMHLHLVTPAAIESAKSSSMLNIFVALLKQLVVEDLYDATAAELNYQIYTHEKGIIIKVNGFNQKLPLLLSTILKYLADCHKLASEDLFNVMKKEQLKSYYNTFLKPGKLNKEVRLSILTSGIWTSTEKHAAVAEITFDQFIEFAKHLTDRMFIQCLAQGNMTQDVVLKSIFQSIEPLRCGILPTVDHPRIKVHEISNGKKCCRVKNFNPMDVNSVVTNYYQSGLASIKQAVITQLLMLIMEEPLFNQLRTQEHLGYNVYCLFNDTFGVNGYSISVCTQANKFTTEHIDERVEQFIQDFKKTLNEMAEDDYSFVRESLIKLKQCTDIHLKEEVNRNWTEIIREEYIFDRYNQEISAIKQLLLGEIRQWIGDHSVEGKNFRKLTVQVVGVDDPNAKLDKIEENDENTDFGAVRYALTFLSGEGDVKKESADYFITDIKGFKNELPVYPTSHNL